MNKKLFSILVILMSLSLIGIIFVQAYYINNALKTKEEQFSFNVKKILTYTSNQIADIEYRKYVFALNDLIARGQEPDSIALRNITIYKPQDNDDQIVVYDTGVTEENYTIAAINATVTLVSQAKLVITHLTVHCLKRSQKTGNKNKVKKHQKIFLNLRSGWNHYYKLRFFINKSSQYGSTAKGHI